MNTRISQAARVGGMLLLGLMVTPLIAVERVTDPKTGIDQKIIVTSDHGGDVFDAPAGVKLSHLSQMQIRFVVQTDEKKDWLEAQGEKWFRISANGSDPVGWISSADVTTWVTRSALIPASDLNQVAGRSLVIKPDDPKLQPITHDGTALDNYRLIACVLSPRESDDLPYKVVVFRGIFREGLTTQVGKAKVSTANLTISRCGNGQCIWCLANGQGGHATFNDGLSGFLCRKHLWEALEARTTLPDESSSLRKASYDWDWIPTHKAVFGKAYERNSNDQVVAQEAWLMRYREVQTLKTRLTCIRDGLEFLSANERKNSDEILNVLALTFAIAGAGQPVSNSQLSDVVKSLPLKNDVLSVTLDEVSKMDDQTFKQWLNRLTVCERRCNELLSIQPGGKGIGQWIALGDDANSVGSSGDSLITFIPVDQLP